MINTKKIKGRLAELGLTQRDVARALGIAQPTVNQKINNIRPMNLDEAKKLAILLDLKVEEFQTYFFIQ
ncbi:MAG: helix-turn-helix transcriptional regulator [Eubacteriales bacterium]|nr:helix-turn-helix transcriptional regulator [Eubacteriales bacterium]